eukprot:7422758-Heterocapsa_arctica.AAC.1
MKNPPHYRVQEHDHGMPCVCADYCFLRDADAEETITCLVCRDTDTKTTFADVCPRKGVLSFDVEHALVNIKRL